MTLTFTQENRVRGQILWGICGLIPVGIQYLLVCVRPRCGETKLEMTTKLTNTFIGTVVLNRPGFPSTCGHTQRLYGGAAQDTVSTNTDKSQDLGVTMLGSTLRPADPHESWV